MRWFGRYAAIVGSAFGVIAFGAILAGCGTASANTATTSATPTCPPQLALKTVTGHITSVGSGTIAVSDAQGAVTQVALTATTRLTQIAHPAATSLAAGASVLVLTDTNATAAQRINVLGTGAGATGGAGGFGFGAGRPSGTPSASARANARCFQRAGQRPGQGTGAGIGAGNSGGQFQGIQGTIDLINSAHLTFHDAQGQEYSVAITPATVIQQTAQARASDLKVGQTVVVVGTATSTGISARSIAIQG